MEAWKLAGYKRKKISLGKGKKDAATRKKERRFIGVFLVLLILIASASAITYFKEKAKTEREAFSKSEITLADNAGKQGAFHIMFAAVAEDEVLYLCILGFDTQTLEYTVTCVNAPPYADPSKPDVLLRNASNTYGVRLDRYVMITREQFKSFMQVLGGYEVELKNRIDYSDRNFTLNLAAGKRTLYGDLFFNYLRFIGLNGSEQDRQKQAGVIVDYISQHLTEETVSQGDDVFSRLVNTCTTNVSIKDFNKYQSAIETSVKDSLRIVVFEPEKEESK